MEFKYILNENTFKALQDISSPEERWNYHIAALKDYIQTLSL